MTASDFIKGSEPALHFSKRKVVFVFTFLLFVSLRVFIEPAAFKDYAQYLDYLSNVKADGIFSGGLDLASNLAFFIAGYFFSDRADAVSALYVYLFLVFVAGLVFITFVKRVDWLNYWAFLVLFGPLLAFVTIRATPAYLAFILAFFFLREGRTWWALSLSIMAVLFHFSALLLLPALLGSLLLHKRLEKSRFVRRLAWVVYLSAIGFGFFMTLFGPGALVSGFELGELFVRYSAYVEEVEPVSGMFHRAYYWGAVILATAYLVYSRDDWRCKSLIMLASCQFFLVAWSPVLAFRQSIFWVAPLLLVLPFKSLLRSRELRVVTAIGMLAVLLYSFFGIFEPLFLETI